MNYLKKLGSKILSFRIFNCLRKENGGYNLIYRGIPLFLFLPLTYIFYKINLKFSIPFMLLDVYMLIVLIIVIIKNKRINNDLTYLSDFKTRVQMFCGDPGSGKTFIASHKVVDMAETVWNNLCFDYWYYSNLVKIDKYKHDELIIRRYRQLKNGYLFWKDYPGIKCLISNIGIETRDGRKCLALKKEQMVQKLFLPRFSVIFLDEISTTLPQLESLVNSKNFRLEDSGRFSRHWDIYILGTEQQMKNITKSLRNVTGSNELMQEMCLVLNGKIIDWLINKLKGIGYNHDKKSKYVFFVKKLENFAEGVGYFKLKSEVYGNLEQGEQGAKGRRKYMLHRYMKFRYDSLAFSNIRQGNDVFDLETWPCLRVTENMGVYKDIIAKYQEQDMKDLERDLKYKKMSGKHATKEL